jgi:hypothetical protein
MGPLALVFLALALPAPAQYGAPIAASPPAATYAAAPVSLGAPVYMPAPGCAAPNSTMACAAPASGPVDEPCGPLGCFWIDGDVLFWHVRGDPTPPLVTTAPANTTRAVAGVLGQPTTVTLVGGKHLDDDFKIGGLIRTGVWFDPQHTDGIELGFFYLAPSSENSTFGGLPVLARPFFSTLDGAQESHLVAFPGIVNGGVSVRSKTQTFGAEANMVFNVCCCGADANGGSASRSYQRLDFLFGYRYLDISDRIFIQENQNFIVDDAFPAGTNVLTSDRFATINSIHAANLILNYRGQWDQFWLAARGEVGLGMVKSSTNIDGQTITTLVGSTPSVTQGGFLAQPTNIGHFHSERFTWIPELDLTAGYLVTENLSVHIGWSFLYVSRVIRAGSQIPNQINTSQLQGGVLIGNAEPVFERHVGEFSLTGLNVGAELRF